MDTFCEHNYEHLGSIASGDLCEYSNDPSGFIAGGIFVDQVSQF
jgi:hypothetical protein